MSHKGKPRTALAERLESAKDDHNGLGYDDFLLRVKLKVNKNQIARDFNVSRNAVYGWFKELH